MSLAYIPSVPSKNSASWVERLFGRKLDDADQAPLKHHPGPTPDPDDVSHTAQTLHIRDVLRGFFTGTGKQNRKPELVMQRCRIWATHHDQVMRVGGARVQPRKLKLAGKLHSGDVLPEA